MKYKNRNGYVNNDETIFMDWTNEELESLGDLSMHYTGTADVYDIVEPSLYSYKLTKPERGFCIDSLKAYSMPGMPSTSWATSIIEVAEKAMVIMSVCQLNNFLNVCLCMMMVSVNLMVYILKHS